jgi:hypothetical protein
MSDDLIYINGNPFPHFNGEALSWSIGLYDTGSESQKDWPKMRAVISAMRKYRPDQLEKERQSLVRAAFDRVFGNAAKTQLSIIEEI